MGTHIKLEVLKKGNLQLPDPGANRTALARFAHAMGRLVPIMGLSDLRHMAAEMSKAARTSKSEDEKAFYTALQYLARGAADTVEDKQRADAFNEPRTRQVITFLRYINGGTYGIAHRVKNTVIELADVTGTELTQTQALCAYMADADYVTVHTDEQNNVTYHATPYGEQLLYDAGRYLPDDTVDSSDEAFAATKAALLEAERVMEEEAAKASQ